MSQPRRLRGSGEPYHNQRPVGSLEIDYHSSKVRAEARSEEPQEDRWKDVECSIAGLQLLMKTGHGQEAERRLCKVGILSNMGTRVQVSLGEELRSPMESGKELCVPYARGALGFLSLV